MTAPIVQYLDFTTAPGRATLHDRKPDGVESVEVTPDMLRALPGLVQALEPFSEWAEQLHDLPEHVVQYASLNPATGKQVSIMVADLRRAAAALRLARGDEA